MARKYKVSISDTKMDITDFCEDFDSAEVIGEVK